jgi:hypothetical protein
MKPLRVAHFGLFALMMGLLNAPTSTASAQSWSLTGNGGTDPANNFIGTTDNQPLILRTNKAEAMRISPGGSIGIGLFDPEIPYPRFTVTGPNATPNADSKEVMRLMRHGVPGVKNQNSAGFFVGAFEPGIIGRGRLDINVSGLPGSQNTFGSVPDVTAMSLLGNGNVGIGGVFFDSTISYPNLTVRGLDATVNVETTEVMRLLRNGVHGVKNSTSAGFYVGAFEPGIIGRGRLDINVSGLPGNQNTFGFVPDVTVMSLLGNGNVGIGTTNPDSRLAIDGGLNVNGTTKTSVLEITGGSDLAESFTITHRASIQPGMAVSIDPMNPGQLRVANHAYDRTVAGIVAGANGITPGVTLSSGPTSAEQKQPVALTGRVYAWADATHYPIRPGDLLTTADTPGHAMKVTNHARAQGAVLGKAMSSLAKGKGLVLVLVSLQ